MEHWNIENLISFINISLIDILEKIELQTELQIKAILSVYASKKLILLFLLILNEHFILDSIVSIPFKLPSLNVAWVSSCNNNLSTSSFLNIQISGFKKGLKLVSPELISLGPK